MPNAAIIRSQPEERNECSQPLARHDSLLSGVCMKICRLRSCRTPGVAVARAIVLNRVHRAAELDVVVVGIVEIACDIAAGLAITQRRVAVVADRPVVGHEATLLRLRRKCELVFETVALKLKRGVKETHPRGNGDFAFGIALLYQHKTFLMIGCAHIAAPDYDRLRSYSSTGSSNQA